MQTDKGFSASQKSIPSGSFAGNPSVDDVRKFWDKNPLFSGEVSASVGSVEWFDQIDDIELEDVFCHDLSALVRPELKGRKVLEVGCGPGFLSRQWGRLGVDYTAIDLAPKSIELAQAGQKLKGLSGRFQLGNAEKLEFADETFDHVVSIGVIHHTPDTQSCINELYRVLKKGGTGSVAVYYKGWLLRNDFFLKAVMRFMGLFGLGLKGRGREKMWGAGGVDELVRMYDGFENPVGKAYTEGDLRRMFAKFDVKGTELYFFPARAFKVRLPKSVHRAFAARLGLMIRIDFKKF